jgi:hypothetical protein
MAVAGRNGPLAPHMRPCTWSTHQMDGQQPPKQAGIFFGGVEGMYGPQNTPMFWQCIIYGTIERFGGNIHS